MYSARLRHKVEAAGKKGGFQMNQEDQEIIEMLDEQASTIIGCFTMCGWAFGLSLVAGAFLLMVAL